MKKTALALLILVIALVSCSKSKEQKVIAAYKDALSAIKKFHTVLTDISEKGNLTPEIKHRFKTVYAKMRENIKKYASVKAHDKYPKIKEELLSIFMEIKSYTIKNLMLLKKIIHIAGMKELITKVRQ